VNLVVSTHLASINAAMSEVACRAVTVSGVITVLADTWVEGQGGHHMSSGIENDQCCNNKFTRDTGCKAHQTAGQAAAQVWRRQTSQLQGSATCMNCCAQVTLSYQRNKLHRGDMALLNCEYPNVVASLGTPD
jgi:hypothetical protein